MDSYYRARHWVNTADGRVRCDVCPRQCELKDGQRGFCFVRQNVGGALVLTTWGRSSGFCVDPIEKKPLNHFLPGTPVLSFGTAGCNLGCRFCQNWDISKSREMDRLMSMATPEKIVETALALGCRSIAFTYNDPVIFMEYAIDIAKEARQAGLKTVAVTAGYMMPKAREDFYLYMDAANVDLKGFTDYFYEKLCFAHLQPVLETLLYLKHQTRVWFEITTLLIPGENDSEEEVAALSGWIYSNLGPTVPLHFSAFHPDFKMMHKAATPPSTLKRARQQALAAGLQYVYTGNIDDKNGGSTYCPVCGECVIERNGYKLGRFGISAGGCSGCGAPISGLLEDVPGTWGRRRLAVNL